MTGAVGTSSQRPDVLLSVQALRFVAAAMVLIGHLQDALSRGRIKGVNPIEDPTHLAWHAGVDIFFVVSGFIMCHVSLGDFGRPGATGQFLWRRIIRVVPLYWLFTTLALAVVFAMPGHMVHDDVSPSRVLGSYLFIPLSQGGAINPLLPVGWTLNFEMIFYAVFAMGLVFPRPWGLAFIATLFLGLVALGQIVTLSLPVAAWANPLVIEFLLGIGLALLYNHGIRLGVSVRIALVILGLGLLAVSGAHDWKETYGRFLPWGVPAALISAGFILGPDFRKNVLVDWLRLGGDSSYALYLSHLFTLRAVGLAWSKTGISSGLVYMAVATIASILVAVAVYLVIERPLLKMLKPSSKPRTQMKARLT